MSTDWPSIWRFRPLISMLVDGPTSEDICSHLPSPSCSSCICMRVVMPRLPGRARHWIKQAKPVTVRTWRCSRRYPVAVVVHVVWTEGLVKGNSRTGSASPIAITNQRQLVLSVRSPSRFRILPLYEAHLSHHDQLRIHHR
jgi:hypothetical protein